MRENFLGGSLNYGQNSPSMLSENYYNSFGQMPNSYQSEVLGDLFNSEGGFNLDIFSEPGMDFSPLTQDAGVLGDTLGQDGGGFLSNLNFDSLGGISSMLGNLANMYFGSKALGLGKDQLKASRRATNQNFKNQAQIYNNDLTNTYNNAMRSNPEAVNNQSLDQFLAQRGLNTDKVV